MGFMRNALLAAGFLAATLSGFGPFLTMGNAGAETIHREDGIHTEAWFNNQTFMVLQDDMADAVKAGKKGMVLIWEQEGCGSCQRLHEVNLQEKPLIDFISKNFTTMSMNMYGEVIVTDFDGEQLPEKDLALKHKVNFTPTTIFFDETGKETFRLPGYFSPYFYLAGFVYAAEKGWENPEYRGMFPRWTRANGDKVRAIYGKPPQ